MSRHNLTRIALMIVTSILFVVSCTYLIHSDEDALFRDDPDTLDLLTLPTSTEKVVRDSIIYDPLFLADGQRRVKGDRFSPKDLSDFRFVDLDNVDWKNVSSQNSDFRGVIMRSANCNEADFRQSDFRFSDLRWTSFNSADLSNSNFAQSMLFRATMNDAKINNADLRACNLFGLKGHRTNFRNCDFSNSLMKEMEVTEADFSGSKAVKVICVLSVFSASRFDSTDLCYTDFTGTGLEDASFVRARLWGASFRGAHLQYADFSHADLKDCNFFGAELAETNFTGAHNIPDYLQNMLENGIGTGVVFHQNNPD